MKKSSISGFYNYFNKYNIIVLIIFFFIPFTAIVLKFTVWNYSFKKILPKTTYDVTLNIETEGYGDDIKMSWYLPVTDERQQISEESHFSGTTSFTIKSDNSGRIGTWEKQNSNEIHQISYHFSFLGNSQQFDIDTTLVIPKSVSPTLSQFLEATENIQVNHPFIDEIYRQHVNKSDNIIEVIRSVFDYVSSLNSKPFKGLTDAVTAAKLNEASCNGKSRLFSALTRKAGIPTRLVGGIILNDGTKKTSHQWVETYIHGHWVPFDALNNHFAYIPSYYLTLYKGDQFLFSHSTNINFNYAFTIKSHIKPNPSLLTELRDTPLNAYKFWDTFTKVGIPLGLIKIIILLPLGALFVAVFRNVIGIQTFGIFLPALIAIASRETGLFYGMTGFLIITGIVALMHFPLQKLGLLYVPKMAIMLVVVIITFILTSILAIDLGLYQLSYVTLFPIVILTITSERFGRKISEDGLPDAVKLMIQTLFVASVTFFVMNSDTLESVFLAFPELLLFIIGTELWLGKWIGLRLTEYRRFRWLIS